VKEKSSTQFIRGNPARKLPFSLLWSGERVFVRHGKTAARTHMMLLIVYVNKTLCFRMMEKTEKDEKVLKMIKFLGDRQFTQSRNTGKS
jgi:hypothetical protein